LVLRLNTAKWVIRKITKVFFSQSLSHSLAIISYLWIFILDFKRLWPSSRLCQYLCSNHGNKRFTAQSYRKRFHGNLLYAEI